MQLDEQQQFKQALIKQLKGQNLQKDYLMKKTNQIKKQYVNYGINCDILKSDSNLMRPTSDITKRLQQLNKKSQKEPVRSQKNIHNQTFGNILQPVRQKQKQPTFNLQRKSQLLPKFSYNKEIHIQKKVQQKINKFTLKQSAMNYQHNDEGIQRKSNEVTRKQIQPLSNAKQTITFNYKDYIKQLKKPSNQSSQFKRSSTFTGQQALSHSRSAQKPKKNYKQDGQKADLLNVSASDYSDMFDSDQQNQDSPILQCKVQAIIEIGNGTHSRLQIYNVELYSNSDLRIVSLYDREFQRHKLHVMKPLPNGYYQLKFIDAKISSRKIKFRGQYQPFMKYLAKSN